MMTRNEILKQQGISLLSEIMTMIEILKQQDFNAIYKQKHYSYIQCLFMSVIVVR